LRRPSCRAGKCLGFVTADTERGLEILVGREVMEAMDITTMRPSQRPVKEAIEPRGRAVQVADLGLKSGTDEGGLAVVSVYGGFC